MMFTLRHVHSGKILLRDDLKQEITGQLQGVIVSGDFDVGFVSGSSICNPADLAEIWSDIKKGSEVVLWCDGLKTKTSSGATSRRQRQARDSDETNKESDDIVKALTK